MHFSGGVGLKVTSSVFLWLCINDVVPMLGVKLVIC